MILFMKPRTHTPFVRLSNQRRRDIVFALKQRVKKTVHGGRYYTDQYLDTSWADISFVSARAKNVLWNATIETCGAALWDKIWLMAFNDAYNALTPQERVERRSTGRRIDGTDYFERVSIDLKYDKFDGRKFNEQITFLQDRYLTGELKIAPSFRILPGFEYGVGLNMIVDEPLITHDAVERAIDAFYSLGETEWQGNDVTVSREAVDNQNTVATLLI